MSILKKSLAGLALVLASTGAAAQAPIDQEAINAAIDRGVQRLLEVQEIDGSWRFQAARYPTGQTALTVYTLRKCGVDRDHPSIQRAVAFLDQAPAAETYSVSCLVMAYTAVDPIKHRERIEELVKLLLGWQRGGFGYPELEVDLSNTQYAALALRIAEEVGISIPRRTWERLVRQTLTHQKFGGAFVYRLSSKPSGSMTSAGLAILGVCRERLEAAGKLSRKMALDIDEARASGLKWLNEHYSVQENPEPLDPERLHDRWLFYYLYNLERVGSLFAIDKIGEHAWYADGAMFLVKQQATNGQWGTPLGENQPNTCFALLFLKRATAPLSGIESGDRRTYGHDSPQLEISLRAAGDNPLDMWISSWGENTLQAYEWPGESGSGLRVKRVEYLIDDRLVHTVPGDPTVACGLERFAYRHSFKSVGEYELVVRAWLVPPPAAGDPAAGADLESVQSPPLDVEISGVVEEWMREYTEDLARNLVAAGKPTVTSSTTQAVGFSPEYAVDNHQGTFWLCKEGDQEPTFTLEFQKPVKADTVLLSPARAEPGEAPGRYARPTKVSVTVNNRRPMTVEMDANEQRKTLVELGRAERIRTLTVVVLERTEGRGPTLKTACGLTEVELQLRED